MSRTLTEQINALEGNDHYENLFFDVAKIRLKLDQGDDLFRKGLDNMPVDKYKAIVNLENKEVLSVVTNQYELISNREAIKKGKGLFKQLTGIEHNGLMPFKVVTPKRKTFCHIDFVSNKANPLTFKQDAWLPFLRVTNSYNKTYVLRYQIGFVRSLCSNGMIFDEESIVVKRTHVQSDGSLEVTANINRQRFKELKNSFINHLEGLYKFNVPKDKVTPLIQQVLNISFNTDSPQEAFREQAIEMENQFQQTIDKLTDTYFEELGSTAYSVLNIMTDMISHEDYDIIPNFTTRESGLQKRVYEWTHQFPKAITGKEFSWSSYLYQET